VLLADLQALNSSSSSCLVVSCYLCPCGLVPSCLVVLLLSALVCGMAWCSLSRGHTLPCTASNQGQQQVGATPGRGNSDCAQLFAGVGSRGWIIDVREMTGPSGGYSNCRLQQLLHIVVTANESTCVGFMKSQLTPHTWFKTPFGSRSDTLQCRPNYSISHGRQAMP